MGVRNEVFTVRVQKVGKNPEPKQKHKLKQDGNSYYIVNVPKSISGAWVLGVPGAIYK